MDITDRASNELYRDALHFHLLLATQGGRWIYSFPLSGKFQSQLKLAIHRKEISHERAYARFNYIMDGEWS